MYHVLISKDGSIEEVCGVTEDSIFAEWWVSECIGGLGPKRIMKTFVVGEVNPSNLEHRYEVYAITK